MTTCYADDEAQGLYVYATKFFADQYSFDPPTNLVSLGAGFASWD